MNSNTLLFLLLLISTMCCSLQFEGEKCLVPATRENGTCMNVQKCEYAKKLLLTKKDPQFCGFLGNIPLVCCPPKPKVARLVCLDYFDIRKQVYAIDLGQKALPKEFPHMAAIGFGSNKTSVFWLCGGTLISHNFVLTAAHCVNSREFGPAKWVRLGDLDLKNTTEDANPQDLAIIAAFVHPSYNSPSHYNDIALLKLENATSYNIFHKAACLHTETNINVENLEAIGWGKQGLFGESSSHLMKVTLKTVDHNTCAKQYSNVGKQKLTNGVLDESQLCAGSELGGDTCPGDSGGPLHYRVEQTSELQRHFVVVGITSFGKGCGGENSVGVYTRVSSFLDWIEKIVWPNKVYSIE